MNAAFVGIAALMLTLGVPEERLDDVYAAMRFYPLPSSPSESVRHIRLAAQAVGVWLS